MKGYQSVKTLKDDIQVLTDIIEDNYEVIKSKIMINDAAIQMLDEALDRYKTQKAATTKENNKKRNAK